MRRQARRCSRGTSTACAGSDLSRGGELDEVVDVRGYEHTIFLVGTFEDVVIARTENPAISNMACIDAIGSQRDRCRRGQVLIEQ